MDLQALKDFLFGLLQPIIDIVNQLLGIGTL